MSANLITIEDYKTLMGITGVKDDEKLYVLIPSISQLVKNYCDNTILDYYSTPYTEYFDIQWDTYTVQLKYSPIVTVSQVYERESQTSEYQLLDANTDYWIDHISDSIFRTDGSGRYSDWKKGVGAVKVIYTNGYENTPEDLKLAVVDLITYYLKDERKERRSLGAATISYAKNANDGSFPDYIKRVLDMYRT
jgi:hypothetical protein